MVLFGKKKSNPLHVAIMMDGNGRWAKNRGLPRSAGHRQGIETLKKIVNAAKHHNIDYLTLFSFSSDNWSRPRSEVYDLMQLFKQFIGENLTELKKSNVRFRMIGERKSLSKDIKNLLVEAESSTKNNTGQNLILAFNYGGRLDIINAIKRIIDEVHKGKLSIDKITDKHVCKNLYTAGIPDPDLLIRTGGEKRLSNFTLWQLAYTELVFFDSFWPDFTLEQFTDALQQYHSRDRRYGGISEDKGQYEN